MPNPLQHDHDRRSNNYDPDWVTENQMGPNVLWLTESLLEELPITPGMKVLDLDLGCGMAVSSIFVAKEFGAHVRAADLWIDASDNQQRIVEAGVDHADMIEHGWKDWLRFDDSTAPTVKGWMVDACKNAHDRLEADRGQHLSFTRIVATKTQVSRNRSGRSLGCGPHPRTSASWAVKIPLQFHSRVTRPEEL